MQLYLRGFDSNVAKHPIWHLQDVAAYAGLCSVHVNRSARLLVGSSRDLKFPLMARVVHYPNACVREGVLSKCVASTQPPAFAVELVTVCCDVTFCRMSSSQLLLGMT